MLKDGTVACSYHDGGQSSRRAADGEMLLFEIMAPRSSSPSSVPPGDALRARVLPQIDRAQRVAAMLDRWEREAVVDEPDWDVDDVDRLALRTSPK